VRIIAEAIGRPLRFEEQTEEQYREQMPPTVEEVTGRPAFTYAQWVAHRVADIAAEPA
jgi:hypothetical protein